MPVSNYSIKLINNSSNNVSACVYQKDPQGDNPNVQSLAWLTRNVPSNAVAIFEWKDEHGFVWGKTGSIRPGSIFQHEQIVTADPDRNNTITFSYSNNYNFNNSRQGGRPGVLSINSDGNLPANSETSVGVSMSGAGTFVTQARPMMNFNFNTKPTFWVDFGNFKQGQVLDLGARSNPIQVEFLNNIHAMDVTLNRDNTWSVNPSRG